MRPKIVYEICAWVWDKDHKRYDAVILDMFDGMGEALADFNALQVSEDMPQIDLYRNTLDRRGCSVNYTLLDRKD